ncbi:glycosyltransferase [Palleronia rufa]|uniref:glycosyltransferase n=1 Tax=Palleronia rufa TaxID=1530186 RepID=UPI0006897C4C|nr:glycosyltransferase [Palleronia rufa]
MSRDALGLRICVVTDTYPKLSETFVRDQVAALSARGAQVSVVTDRLAAPPAERDGLSRRWGAVSLAEPWLRRLPPRLADRAVTGLDRAFAGRLRGYDAIVSHFGMNGVRVARAGRRTAGFPPLITIFHGFDVGMAAHDGTLGQYRPLFSAPGLLLTVNHPFRDTLVAAGAPPDRTRVHHLGIDPDRIAFRTRDWTGPLRVLTVGRLTQKKGIAQALAAMAALRDRHPGRDWRYDIIGDGELRASLEQQSAELGLNDRVTFHGALPHDRVKAAMQEADVFLLPSLTAATGDMEGLPIVLMEAMAAGMVAVSTRHSGIPELIEHGVSGVLAAEGDVPDLVDRLAWVLDHPDRLGAMAAAARKAVETSFNTDRQTDELIAHVRALRDARPRPKRNGTA